MLIKMFKKIKEIDIHKKNVGHEKIRTYGVFYDDVIIFDRYVPSEFFHRDSFHGNYLHCHPPSSSVGDYTCLHWPFTTPAPSPPELQFLRVSLVILSVFQKPLVRPQPRISRRKLLLEERRPIWKFDPIFTIPDDRSGGRTIDSINQKQIYCQIRVLIDLLHSVLDLAHSYYGGAGEPRRRRTLAAPRIKLLGEAQCDKVDSRFPAAPATGLGFSSGRHQ